MSVLVEQVRASLLQPSNLDLGQLEPMLGRMLSRGADYADLYFQHADHEMWMLENGIIKEGSYSTEQGVGARVVSGEKTGLAYSDEISLAALESAASAARSISRSGQEGRVPALRASQVPVLYTSANPLQSMRAQEKVALLQGLDEYTRSLDQCVCEVIVSLAASCEQVLIVATDGTLAADTRPMSRLSVQVIVERDGRREIGHCGGGGRVGLDFFQVDDRAREYARDAVRQALLNLDAVDAPAGQMPVVLGAGWPGILLHEAVGHGLEGDFNRKGTSAFSGKMGQKVASDACTIVDDGTMLDARGSMTIDDEGVPGEYTTLIENGILRCYMQDKTNARLMGVKPTGNGRRESFAHMTMPRMTNTYMLAGKYAREEVIASVDDGIYAPNFGGGQVDITSGKFVFSISEAYRIRKGKLCEPIKKATLIGNGPEAMQQVKMVADDLKMDLGVGTCGKEGQSVPVGVGQPTLRIDGLVVGGVGARG